MERIVARLREAGVTDIAVRMDKGFAKKGRAEFPEGLGVKFLMKIPEWDGIEKSCGEWEESSEHVFADGETWVSEGKWADARLMSVQHRRRISRVQRELYSGCEHVIVRRAMVLTNIEGIDPIEAWSMYNDGAVVEQRIEEMYQLGAGATAVDDEGGNATLWSLSVLAYQLQHTLRELPVEWEDAAAGEGRKRRKAKWLRPQPKTLRRLLLKVPAKITRHARKIELQLVGGDRWHPRLMKVLTALDDWMPATQPA